MVLPTRRWRMAFSEFSVRQHARDTVRDMSESLLSQQAHITEGCNLAVVDTEQDESLEEALLSFNTRPTVTAVLLVCLPHLSR
jgi:hypothetical protein